MLAARWCGNAALLLPVMHACSRKSFLGAVEHAVLPAVVDVGIVRNLPTWIALDHTVAIANSK